MAITLSKLAREAIRKALGYDPGDIEAVVEARGVVFDAEQWQALQERVAEAVAEERRRRNRKPRRETEERDAKIAKLRDSNPKFWTWTRLAKHFHMSRTAVRKAYARHHAREKKVSQKVCTD